MKIKVSKKNWEEVGKRAGWIKTAIRDIHDMFVSFADETLFDDEKDVKLSIKNGNIKPDNIWMITYNSSALNDDQLSSSMWDNYQKGMYGGLGKNDINYYKQYFLACSIKATNYSNGRNLSSEELVDFIWEFSDIWSFFGFIKDNQTNYKIEREIEKSEMEYRDDQLPGEYELHGHDAQKPQF